jgi:hypothetical protein
MVDANHAGFSTPAVTWEQLGRGLSMPAEFADLFAPRGGEAVIPPALAAPPLTPLQMHAKTWAVGVEVPRFFGKGQW